MQKAIDSRWFIGNSGNGNRLICLPLLWLEDLNILSYFYFILFLLLEEYQVALRVIKPLVM